MKAAVPCRWPMFILRRAQPAARYPVAETHPHVYTCLVHKAGLLILHLPQADSPHTIGTPQMYPTEHMYRHT